MPPKTLVAVAACVLLALVIGGCATPDEELATSTANATEARTKTSKRAVLPIACGAVTEAGHCASASVLEICVKPSESTSRTLVQRTCGAGEECVEDGGRARCAPLEGRCIPGAERCVTSGSVQHCDEEGKWAAAEPCAACTNSEGVGVTCPGTLAPGSTTKKSGTLDYEFHGPNAVLTDWDRDGVDVIAPRVLVVSLTADPARPNKLVPLDATMTGDDGSFELTVPKEPSESDRIAAIAVRIGANGKPSYAVGRPDVADGRARVETQIPPANERSDIWKFLWNQRAFTDVLALHVSEEEGAGALNIFDMMRRSHEAAAAVAGPTDRSLIVWMRQNTTWDCGACFIALPESFAGARWDGQMFIGGDTLDRGYWADGVLGHEAGHAMMGAYGLSPGEGGQHAHGCDVMPGMAWSEGWATAFSSLVRSDPVLFDKQDGEGFAIDIARRTYSNNAAWRLPRRAGGILQPINEDEIAASLWALANHPTSSDALTATPELFQALTSKRMTAAPFARGYTAHVSTGTCEDMTAEDTGVASPMFADYLDALRCAGFDAQRVATAIGDYPYPIDSAALCD